jgi:chorismate--pyruvate lyase
MPTPPLERRLAAGVPADDEWVRLDDCLLRAPLELHAWLAEPGLLTARVRKACGGATRFTLLRLEPAPLQPALARRMGVTDAGCLLREIEFACGGSRWIFAQSVFPDSTVRQHAWLAELGNAALGESLLGRADVSREPLEYRELAAADELTIAAGDSSGRALPLWGRRAVYHLSDAPILVQEVFLPALLQCGPSSSGPGSR